MKIWLIIFLVLFKASHGVQSQSRRVVNTTCLELAKPSNQQFRLTCRQYDYHCLQDDTFTKEFEVCREWKWIPGGNCAYFNTYGSGNVDERGCTPGINLTCSQSKHQFESNKNTQFSACYVKRDYGTSLPTSTSPVQVTSVKASNGDTARSSQTSKAWIVLLVFIVITAICLSIFVILFIHGKKTLCEKVGLSLVEEGGSSANTEWGLHLIQSESRSENKSLKQEEVGLSLVEEGGSSANTEGSLLLKQSESRSENQSLKQEEVEEDSDHEEPENYEDALTDQEDSGRQDDPKENSAEISPAGSCSASAKSYHEAQDIKESTDIFDGTLESLQKKLPTPDAQDGELCKELFNLLQNEGRNLSQKVMSTVITRIFGKSVKKLLADETIKNKVMEKLEKTYHHILKDSLESEQSIHVLYNLLRNNLGKEYHPKSGWGNPVCEEDRGIGDDVERLYKVHTFIEKIQNQMTVSVESYIRLLDIMVEALIRLDSGAIFEEDYKLLSYKLKRVKNPNLTQAMLNKIMTMVGLS